MTNPPGNSEGALLPDDAMGQALEFLQRGMPAEAEVLYRRIVAADHSHFDALHMLGLSVAQQGRLAEASEIIRAAIQLNPTAAAAHMNLGNVYRLLGHADDALASYAEAIFLDSENADAYNNRGKLLNDMGRLGEALADYDAAVVKMPAHADAQLNRGKLLQSMGRFDVALSAYRQAAAYIPGDFQLQTNIVDVLNNLGRFDEALSVCDSLIKTCPGDPGVHNNRGVVLRNLGRFEEALASYECVLTIMPNHPEAWINRSAVLADLMRFPEALASCDRALQLRPAEINVCLLRGVMLGKLGRFSEALESYEYLLKIIPDRADVFHGRGDALRELGRLADAVVSYERALQLQPGREFLRGILLHTRMKICDWSGLPAHLSVLSGMIAAGEKVSPPFPILALCGDPRIQRKAAEIWVREKNPPSHALPEIVRRARRDKIRVGYFSGDYFNHATAYLMAELFETHDRSRFDWIAFSFGPQTNDEMAQRIAAAFDTFVDVRSRSNRDIALLTRQMEIDIAVDLKGFTQNDRAGIFAHRAAPLQVNYLGYPGTMGAEYIDYLIADHVLIPKDHQQYYSEKIVYLPDSYQVNDRRRRISGRVYNRAELGLPPSGFVFCCFNSNYKITPDVFNRWMRILAKADGSVLWLFGDNPSAVSNLRSEAVRSGVAAERLIFAQRMALSEHLARHRCADLFLDTLPYNAHTTASDALLAGLPVLTCAGDALASRVAASLLTAIGLPDLIAASEEEFEALAVELATDPHRITALRERLADKRLTAPLFNTERFAKHIEQGYVSMYERYMEGLPPDHIEIRT